MKRPEVIQTLEEKYGERLGTPVATAPIDNDTRSHLLKKIISDKSVEEVIFIQGPHTAYHYKPEKNIRKKSPEFPRPQEFTKQFLSTKLTISDAVYIIPKVVD